MRHRRYADGGRPLEFESANALRAMARNLQALVVVVSDPASKLRMETLAARYIAVAEKQGADE